MHFPIWVKTYGGPKDNFVRVFDTYTLVPAGLAPDGVPLYDVNVRREVLARGYVNQLDVTIGFVRDPVRLREASHAWFARDRMGA